MTKRISKTCLFQFELGFCQLAEKPYHGGKFEIIKLRINHILYKTQSIQMLSQACISKAKPFHSFCAYQHASPDIHAISIFVFLKE